MLFLIKYCLKLTLYKCGHTDIKLNRKQTENAAVNRTAAEPQEVKVCVPGLGQDALYALHFVVSHLHLLRTERLFRVQVQISLGDENLVRLRQLQEGEGGKTPTTKI